MILISLFLIKFILTILIVLALSILAEKVSPKVSGIISGIPTGTAIILFFYAIEYGTSFAKDSSVFNLAGMVAIHVFLFTYYKFSVKNSNSNIILSTLIACLTYLITAAIIRQFNFTLFSAVILSLASLVVFTYLFKKIDNSQIKNKVKLSIDKILIRCVIAASIVLLITGIANFIGPEWAGIFSAFPTTVLPLILIMHGTYGREHSHTIIKNVPKGQWSIVIYSVSVFYTYPRFGPYLGTLYSYSFVLLFLAILFYISRKNSKGWFL